MGNTEGLRNTSESKIEIVWTFLNFDAGEDSGAYRGQPRKQANR